MWRTVWRFCSKGCCEFSELIPIFGGKIADKMPWEALERRFINTSLVYHPVRVDGTIRAVPPERPLPLRVALLVGHEGAGGEFERDQELAGLKGAFNASAQVNRRIVDADAIATLDLSAVRSSADRRSFFRTADPHVVFYFGHGKAESALGVGPGRGDWLPLRELADDAAVTRPFPASWIFIACSIGDPPNLDTGPAGPEAFRILASRGARAMLAMRARIRPRIARIVAASLARKPECGRPFGTCGGNCPPDRASREGKRQLQLRRLGLARGVEYRNRSGAATGCRHSDGVCCGQDHSSDR